jgi:hypothetical protein
MIQSACKEQGKARSDLNIVGIQIFGGLGNQLFQYAAARRLALVTESELVLDTHLLGAFATPRNYEVGKFPISGRLSNCAFVSSGDEKTALLYPQWCGHRWIKGNRIVWRLARELGSMFANRLRIHRETSASGFDATVLNLTPGVLLHGYWQSAAYFSDIEETIRQDLRFTEVPDEINRMWLHRIMDTEAVAVHVRRADYPESELCSLKYYQSAMALVRSRTVRPRFFVFSDDLPWCRKNLTELDVDFVNANTCGDPIRDMRLMAACRSHILSNPSYSP